MFPGTLRKIDDGTFASCSSLRTIVLEGGCTANVGKLAGKGVKLKRLYVPLSYSWVICFQAVSTFR